MNWRELKEMQERAARVTARFRAAKRAVEQQTLTTGLCVMCGERPPTECGTTYASPVYCRPCDRLLDVL